MSANPIKKPVTIRQVVRAMRSRWLIESRTVMAKNAGKLTTGSTIDKEGAERQTRVFRERQGCDRRRAWTSSSARGSG
jgi:hypothetical protein